MGVYKCNDEQIESGKYNHFLLDYDKYVKFIIKDVASFYFPC